MFARFFVMMSLFVTSLAYADDGIANTFKSALNSGSYALALGLVFLGGIATSLTPCVYPMIAITVSVFGARQVKSRWEGAGLSTVFVLGIAALFTPLGLFAAVTGDVFGAALASPVVLIGLALLFLTMAASMFGAFELNLPPALQNRLAQVGGVGYKGAFFIGMVSALIAAPCTGPVLGFLLTWVGTSGNVTFGALALFAYSLGLGLLFWLVGTFSVSLPKSGRWLEWIKSIFGVVMIVAALYYLQGIIPILDAIGQKTSPFLLTSLALITVGVALGAIHLSYHTPSMSVRIRKTLGVLSTVAGVFGIIAYLQALPAGAKLKWLDNYQSAKSLALSEGKPLLVDFGASWCGACGELDRHTFSDPRVVKAGRDFVAVHVDLSPGKDTPDNKAALAGYNQRGLPLVVVHDRKGNEVGRITEFVPPTAMLKLMRAAR